MNDDLAEKVLAELKHTGVEEFVIAPGSRNSPLIHKVLDLRYYNFYEERSAAFFALGRCRASIKPVAVITTSGTAVAELLPASIEAYYSGTPLVLVTADRPRRFRGTGAPQAIEQAGLFSTYAPFSIDIEGGDSFSLNTWDRKFPAHINVCFEEPKRC